MGAILSCVKPDFLFHKKVFLMIMCSACFCKSVFAQSEDFVNQQHVFPKSNRLFRDLADLSNVFIKMPNRLHLRSTLRAPAGGAALVFDLALDNLKHFVK
jgi:hypothetical protein